MNPQLYKAHSYEQIRKGRKERHAYYKSGLKIKHINLSCYQLFEYECLRACMDFYLDKFVNSSQGKIAFKNKPNSFLEAHTSLTLIQ